MFEIGETLTVYYNVSSNLPWLPCLVHQGDCAGGRTDMVDAIWELLNVLVCCLNGEQFACRCRLRDDAKDVERVRTRSYSGCCGRATRADLRVQKEDHIRWSWRRRQYLVYDAAGCWFAVSWIDLVTLPPKLNQADKLSFVCVPFSFAVSFWVLLYRPEDRSESFCACFQENLTSSGVIQFVLNSAELFELSSSSPPGENLVLGLGMRQRKRERGGGTLKKYLTASPLSLSFSLSVFLSA